MVEAVVEFDYTAVENDELSIRKGDAISDVKMLPGGWWEGTLAGKRGMFPDNFVKIVTKPESNSKSVSPANNDVTLRPKGGRRCKVLFSYQPANEDELQLNVNDIIQVLAEVEDGWWRGSLGDMVGVFPSNFVSEILTSEEPVRPRPGSRDESLRSQVDSESDVSSQDSSILLLDSPTCKTEISAVPSLPPKPVKELCRALYAYEAANGDELTLKEGDILTLVTREVADKGWWRGELRGRIGLFPDNFVQVIEEEPPKKPERNPVTKSPVVTTNRVRDSITKPSAAKSEVPPIPGKKPQVSLVGKKSVAVIVPYGDSTDGAGPSRPTEVEGPTEVVEFDSVERSAMLTHPTASRARAPTGRRPPSSGLLKDGEPALTNGSESEDTEPDPTLATKKQSWEKHKAPWMEELKLKQTKPEVPKPNAKSARPQSMFDFGNKPGANVKLGSSPPQTNRSAASPPLANNLSNRATASPPMTTSMGSKSAASPMSTSLGSKSGASPPPTNNLGSKTAASSKPSAAPPMSTSLGSKSALSPIHSNNVGSKLGVVPPLSGKTGISPPTKLSRGSSKSLVDVNDAAVNNGSVKQEVKQEVNHMSGVSDNVGDLKALVRSLQKSLELQKEEFTQALRELTDKLNEEMDKRKQIEQQLNKLTDLVTQV